MTVADAAQALHVSTAAVTYHLRNWHVTKNWDGFVITPKVWAKLQKAVKRGRVKK